MKQIGRYQIEAEIGRGAMGVVYLAHDPRLGRHLAVKTHVLPEGLSPADKDEFHQRFLREARAAAGLSHPAIVTVYDAGEDPDRKNAYIAMEYVPGQSLKEIFEAEGPLELERLGPTVGMLADALQAAHDAGIVHRDIKPANLLVRESDGAVKIADFGVARLATSDLTQSGTSIGSPAYMSPEQVLAQGLDGRSDFFSLAVILYELLCGRRPFEGEETAALIYSIVHETPIPISKRVDGLPPGLDGFFDRALAKEPGDRFADGSEFKRAFEEACRNTSSSEVEATVRQPLDVTSPPRASDAEKPSAPLVDPGDPEDRRSSKRPILVAAAALFLVWAGWSLLAGKEQAHLRLDAKSGVESGELTLLIDGNEVYRRDLYAPRRKRGLIKKMLNQDMETFEAWIEIPPGKHEVMARVLPGDGGSEYHDTIVIDVEPGETYEIKLTAGRRFGSDLSLKAD